MTRYWCEYAWLGGPKVEQGVVVDIDGGHIAAVTPGVERADADSIPLQGLTLPALANSHSHAFHRVLRGRTHHGRGSFWTWRDLMYEAANRLDPDRYHRLARAVFTEMALAGIGVVGEFHYVHHRPDGEAYLDANAIGKAVVSAAADVGLRLTLLDTLYLRGGFTEGNAATTHKPVRGTKRRVGQVDAVHEPLRLEQRRFGDADADAWIERVNQLRTDVAGPSVLVGAAIHSVRAVDPTAIKQAAEWATGHRMPLHIHVSEQPAENEQCRAAFGQSPVQVLDEAGALSAATTLVHGTHFDSLDISAVAASKSMVCLCPTTERDLADGIGPSAELAQAGVGICLGSDSHAVIDPFEETRAVELNQRLSTQKRGVHSASDLAKMATGNGYQSLGWNDGATLAPGALADFTTVAIDGVHLAGTDADSMLAAAVFAGAASDVTHLVVGGKSIVVDGQHVSIDAAAELSASVTELMSP